MAKKLSELQVGVRHLARDTSLDLTIASNLEIVNRTYRFLVSSLPWSEFRRLDTTMSTEAGVATVAWTVANTFIDVKSVEIQDAEDGDKYKPIYVSTDEWNWSEAESLPNQSVPSFYVRYYNTSMQAEYLEFRPAPKYGSKTIRVTGVVEPTDLENASDTTLFLRRTADDALEYLISADIVGQAGDVEWANQLVNKAILLLQQAFGKEKVPEELLRQVIQQ